MKIGSIQLDFPVVQAALSGYSDAPMRRLAKKFGASFTLCEVFLDQFVLNVSKRSKAKLYLAVQDSDHPCGAQLMGNEPEEFVAAAQRLIDFGFDLIDLNFACPVKKVVGKCRGGYLMSNVEQSLKIAEKVRKAIPDEIPLTVKLRKGFDDSKESRDLFFKLLDGLLDIGINGITLHGRSVRQRYEGSSDWNFIAYIKRYLVDIKKRPDLSLIGSGDLFSADVCLQCYQESGVDGLALARGIIGNPWLFRDVFALFQGKPLPPRPSIQEQGEVIADHYRQVEELYGERRSATEMRKFGVKYALLHPLNEELRSAYVLCKNRKMWADLMKQYYNVDL
ncbi:MAG: tRNA-dihydrouridine synthase [Planctomycetia bacterium]|nr:tRNA-dihydrouridine synthase [Planctomycetia bacterium]